MTDKQDEKDERRELDDKYYHRFDDLNEARPIFKGIEEAFLCFARNILNDYKAERLILEKRMQIEEVRDLYKIELTSDNLLPRTWRNWKRLFRREQNLAKTLLDEEVERDTKQFFKGCLKRLREREAEEREEELAEDPAEDITEDPQPESVQCRAPYAVAGTQQFITVYVAGSIPPSFIKLEAGADQPSDGTPEIKDPAEEETQDVEIQVEGFDENYGIDTEYKIVEDGEETPEESGGPTDEPESELVADEVTEAAPIPEPGADELSEGVQDGEPIEEENDD